ncbi:MAG: methyltransferase [Chitinophagaceae bacterium]|nr:methyltransferase [Chitinophagaceae bacterium]
MANTYFQFKQFIVHQDQCAMKVTTDGCLFGAWVADIVRSKKPEGGSEQLVKRVLDIGTGTGLLSLMLAQANPNLLIDAVEIDPDAADQAATNVAASPWADRINVVQADIKEFSSANKYDLVISNPPFYENELKGDDAKKNTAHHEGGLLLPELLGVIKEQLKPGGRFFLLLPYKRNEEIKELLLRQPVQTRKLVLVKPVSHHSYFRILIECSFHTDKERDTSIDELCIKDENGSYSPDFIRLLKDYYLHL